MPIQKCKPTSPGRRFVEKVVHSHLHKGAPYAPLVEAKNVLVVVITTVTLRLVTLVVDTSKTTVSLTLNVTKMAFLQL